jgi:hypothetical protein
VEHRYGKGIELRMTEHQAAIVIQRYWRHRRAAQRKSIAVTWADLPVYPSLDHDIDLGWNERKTELLSAGTHFIHATADGVFGGVGQSGYAGAAIWVTSINDHRAAYGYAGKSNRCFRLRALRPLKLAVLDEAGDQVFPDELAAWNTLARRHGLDGVKTQYAQSYEVVLFNRSTVGLVDVHTLSSWQNR